MTPLSSPSVTAIICAAGKGERAGMNGNKLFAPLYGGVSASAKNETKREKTAENGRMERMSGQCERADETNKRATRTKGLKRTNRYERMVGRNERTDGTNGRTDGQTDGRKKRAGF